MEEHLSPPNKQSIEIYVLSGGVGASGEQIARTVAAQYRHSEIQIEIFPKISAKRQIGRILKKASEIDAVIVHSFVDPNLHRKTIKTAQKLGLVAIDLAGQSDVTLSFYHKEFADQDHIMSNSFIGSGCR